MSEIDVHDALAAEDADELPCRAIDEDQHDEPELDGPEVGPHDLVPEIAIAFREASRAPPEGKEMLQVVHEERGGHVDSRFPDHVVDEGLLREAVDERELVREEHDLGYEESHDRGRCHGGELQAVLAQHEGAVDE